MVERRGKGQQFYEEYAYVLDYLLHGKPGSDQDTGGAP